MIDGIAATEATSRTSASRTSLVSNFETFLQLLTAQLKNQDPLSPLDSNEFTAQLTQMTGVEQQLLTNDLLTSLLAAQQGAQQGGGGLDGATSYIGKEATAVWAATKLQDGQASWAYELGAAASSATLEVLDSAGKVVWTGNAPERGTGTHDFAWNGKTTAGGQLPDGGVYSLKITATNGANEVKAQVLTRGRVSGIELDKNVPYLTIGGSIVPVSTVIALSEPKVAVTP